MGKPVLFVTRRLPGRAIDELRNYYDVHLWEDDVPPHYDKLVDEAVRSDALVTLLSDEIDCSLLRSASPKLRIVAQYATGYDNIDVECATRLGIYITNTPEVLTEAVADLTWALIMAVARRIIEADRYVREGDWGRSGIGWHPTLLLGTDIHGRTIGIIGMGRIGRAVAKRARGFGMRILYNSRRRLPDDVERELGAEYMSLGKLLGESDVITLHVPLTSETRYMIDEEKLRLMKRTAILVNTSRGGVVSTDALIKALKEGWILGAGLDVFEEEPLPPGHPLTGLNNVVLAPHIGSGTRRTRERMAELVAENLVAFSLGRVPPNLVNVEVTKVRGTGF